MTTFEQAYQERWPTPEQLEREVYRPLTHQERQQIRDARDRHVRERIAAENERRKIVCACPVCLGREEGEHGESLYAHGGCRCVECRKAHTDANRERKRRYEENYARVYGETG